MKASEDEPARRAARRGARLARPARHTMQLDRDEGRGPFKIPRGEGGNRKRNMQRRVRDAAEEGGRREGPIARDAALRG
eukprot:scaffold10953_cov120-Isochrysis_galbana.AAC.4